MLASLARFIRSLACSLTHPRANWKTVLVYEMNSVDFIEFQPTAHWLLPLVIIVERSSNHGHGSPKQLGFKTIKIHYLLKQTKRNPSLYK